MLFYAFSQFHFIAYSGEVNPPIAKDRVVEAMDSLKYLGVFPDSLSLSAKGTDNLPDLAYEYKLAAIDAYSPIDFDYNQHVRRYISIYATERPGQVSQMLGLSKYYFPLFDEYLDKYQLPLELKYLSVVESALNPLAVSTSGAVGLWQFKINSGKMFDLEVNSYVDDRMDPDKSTEAACKYLLYLYRIFNDWHLALAAYNTGPGAVRNAIQRSGGETNFWKLYPHLPEVAQNYVSAFIAAAYIMNNYADHGIEPAEPIVNYMETDTVAVRKPLSLRVVSQRLNIGIDLLRFLNPTFRRDYVPAGERIYYLRLPSELTKSFIGQEESLYAQPESKKSYHDVVQNAGSTKNKVKIFHRVRSGEYLHKISMKYGCTTDDLIAWNPNSGTELSVGQILTVWVDKFTYNRLSKSMEIDSISAN